MLLHPSESPYPSQFPPTASVMHKILSTNTLLFLERTKQQTINKTSNN